MNLSTFYDMDIYWIVLLIVGILMFILSIITIIVLCLLWRRERLTTIKPNENVQTSDRQSPVYETQVLTKNKRVEIKTLFFFYE